MDVYWDKKNSGSGLCFSTKSLEELNSIQDFYLHVSERDYFKNLIYPRKRYSYLMGRFCAKQAISAYLNRDNCTFMFIENGIFQQPVVHNPLKQNLQVSISHTDTMGAALAFSESCPMGIDIEVASEIKLEAMLTQITKAEHRLSSSLFESEVIAMTNIWTVKEALSKVLKCGLMISYEMLEIAAFRQNDQYIHSSFKHLYQYEAVSFSLNNTICSIVYPKNCDFNLDISNIQSIFLYK